MPTDDQVDRPRGVYLTAAVTTQDAFRDERGRTHLIGIFDRLSTQSFPLTAEFMVWCNIKGHGTGTIHLRLIDAESAALAHDRPAGRRGDTLQGTRVVPDGADDVSQCRSL